MKWVSVLKFFPNFISECLPTECIHVLEYDTKYCDASGYSSSCCTPEKPCEIGKGDCDVDGDCIGDLLCGVNNCGNGFPDKADCCKAAPGIIREHLHFELKKTYIFKIMR